MELGSAKSNKMTQNRKNPGCRPYRSSYCKDHYQQQPFIIIKTTMIIMQQQQKSRLKSTNCNYSRMHHIAVIHHPAAAAPALPAPTIVDVTVASHLRCCSTEEIEAAPPPRHASSVTPVQSLINPPRSAAAVLFVHPSVTHSLHQILLAHPPSL